MREMSVSNFVLDALPEQAELQQAVFPNVWLDGSS